MTDDLYYCKCCRHDRSRMRDGAPKIMPKGSAARTGCPSCWKRAQEFGAQARDFSVERNFKKPGTSSEAAQKAAKVAKLNDTHRKLYRALLSRPMTADEAGEVCGLNILTARPRMSDLVKAGWAEETGERRAPHKDASPRNVYRAVSAEERNVA